MYRIRKTLCFRDHTRVRSRASLPRCYGVEAFFRPRVNPSGFPAIGRTDVVGRFPFRASSCYPLIEFRGSR